MPVTKEILEQLICDMANLPLFTDIYLEPVCPLFLALPPPKRALSSQNEGHLGSRYICKCKTKTYFASTLSTASFWILESSA